MITLDEYKLLKAKADNAKSEGQKFEGIAEQQQRDIARDFGCATVEEGDQLVAQLRQEEATLKADAEQKMADFKAQYGQLL